MKNALDSLSFENKSLKKKIEEQEHNLELKNNTLKDVLKRVRQLENVIKELKEENNVLKNKNSHFEKVRTVHGEPEKHNLVLRKNTTCSVTRDFSFDLNALNSPILKRKKDDKSEEIVNGHVNTFNNSMLDVPVVAQFAGALIAKYFIVFLDESYLCVQKFVILVILG